MSSTKSCISSVALVIIILSTIGLTACSSSPATTTTHPITTTNPPTTTTVPPTTTTVPPTTTTVPPTTTTVPPTTTTAPPSTAGASLYSANCAACHGADRKGISVGATVLYPPVLSTSVGVSTRSQDALAAFIATHQTGSTMTADNRTILAAYLKATP